MKVTNFKVISVVIFLILTCSFHSTDGFSIFHVMKYRRPHAVTSTKQPVLIEPKITKPNTKGTDRKKKLKKEELNDTAYETFRMLQRKKMLQKFLIHAMARIEKYD